MSFTHLRTAAAWLLCTATIGSYSFALAAERKAPSSAAAATGQVVVEETFAATLGAEWKRAKGDWQIVDGALQGAEKPEDNHGAVVRYSAPFTDARFEFDFKLDGTKGISLSVNDAGGHVCRLSIKESGFIVSKDDHDHAGPDKGAVLHSEKAAIAPGKWYHVRVELAGPRMMAQVGDASNPGSPVGGEHPMLAGPKTNFGFTVAGKTASFKNLRVTKSK